MMQVYSMWTEYFGQQLLQIHRELEEELVKSKKEKTGKAKLVVEIYQFLEQEWREWLQGHLESVCPAMDLGAALEKAQEQEGQELDFFRNSIWSEHFMDHYLKEMEDLIAKKGYFEWEPREVAHKKKRLQEEIENKMKKGLESLARHEVCFAIECFGFAMIVEKKFRRHLPSDLRVNVNGFCDQIMIQSLSLCKTLADDICTGCTSGKTIKHFQTLSDYVCYFWPLLTYSNGKQPPNLLKACRGLHDATIERLGKDLQQLEEHCASMQVDAVKVKLEQCRRFALMVVGGFAVYAEDVEPLLGAEALSSYLHSAVGMLQRNFAEARVVWPVARALARLELAPGCCSKDVKNKKRLLSKKHHPDRAPTENSTRRRTEVMQRINAAADLLQGDLGQGYLRQVNGFYSEKVRQSFDALRQQVQNHLEQRMYEDVLQLLHSVSKWRVLQDLITPPLEIEKLEHDMHNAVERHATEMTNQALGHFEKSLYKSLQHTFASLVGLLNLLGANHEAMCKKLNRKVDDLRSRIMQRIDDVVHQARRSLRSPSDIQMYSFAKDLINLGLMWCELSSFGVKAHQRLGELLNACMQQGDAGLGPSYLLKLGRHLAQERDDEGAASTN
eukprot:6491207-Amphidinium_carterae.1